MQSQRDARKQRRDARHLLRRRRVVRRIPNPWDRIGVKRVEPTLILQRLTKAWDRRLGGPPVSPRHLGRLRDRSPIAGRSRTGIAASLARRQ